MKTAIIILSYNMLEQTDKLCEHIIRTVKQPYELIVVDNGSDIVEPSKYSTVLLSENVQTTNGFLVGLDCADMLGEDFFAYWLIITSAEFFEDDDRDPLEILIPVLKGDPLAFVVSPAIVFDGKEAWYEEMHPKKDKSLRKVHRIDYISALFRAEYLNQIGRFREELTMMWGVPGECNWKARKKGWNIYIHDGYSMMKHTNIGYKMDRMGMTAADRRELAALESDEVLEPIYGKHYRERFGQEYR